MSARTELVDGYRCARETQLERFESATQGVDRSDSGSPEFAEYFGLGEYAGGGVEAPLTFKRWLIGSKRPVDDRAEDAADDLGQRGAPVALVTVDGAFWLSGHELRDLAEAGCVNAAAEVNRRAAKRRAKRLAALSGEVERWDRALGATGSEG